MAQGQGATSHDHQNMYENTREVGWGSWVRQLAGFYKGGIIMRDRWSDELDMHMFDELPEFPETELDVARIKAWTRDLDEATNKWFACKRKKGRLDVGACIEEGEALRRSHWKHQLQIQEAGCEKALYRFAKCVQRCENRYHFCRDLETQFVQCTVDAGTMELMPTTPPELQRLERYTGFFPYDVILYKRWIQRRDEFLQKHPNWFADDDVEVMDTHQLYKFISKKDEWIDRGDTKPFSTFAYPQRYREYVWKKDRIVE